MAAQQTPEAQEFSIGAARRIVGDLFQPVPWIFWADFLVSILAGHACAIVVRTAGRIAPESPGLRIALMVVAFFAGCLLYYRAGLFIHDLAHLRSGEFRAFRIVWNILAGIPFLTPSFTYRAHLDHHRRHLYGGEHDGEYLPFSSRSPWLIVGFLAESLVIPVLVFVRFAMAPLAWALPPLRRWLDRHASSLVINPTYVRTPPTGAAQRVMRLQEAACFAWLAALFVGAWIIHGRLPYPALLHGYLIGVTVIFLNAVRTLAAHRYLHQGRELTMVEQLLDSTNFAQRPWINELWAPVGLRFHALHHLFPSLPYHNLGRAHRRLMAQLPPDSPYRLTEETSLATALISLWRRARASRQSPPGSAGPMDSPLQGVTRPARRRGSRSRKAAAS